MKSFYSLLSFFALFFLACQPAPKRQLCPEALEGNKIAFYHLVNVWGKSNRQGDMLCIFKKNGHYVGLLDGEEFDYGKYDYEVHKDSEEAQIFFHSDIEGQETWGYKMSYNSPYSGQWHLLEEGNGIIAASDVGDFRFL